LPNWWTRTRSQMAKLLCAIPVLYPILAELEVEAIIDKYCPTKAEVNIGAVIVILCLNRPVAPRPLSGVADWAAKTVIEELTGVPASKLNDDRLGRTLDAIYPYLEDIWVEIVSQALVRYEIDLSLVFYDLTSFYFEGEYKKSKTIVLGYNRTHKGKKQRKLALNVTAREKFPFLYQLLDGNTADVSTVQENMQRLLKALQKRGWPVNQVLVVGDRAMLSAEIVRAYHRAGLKYLGALKVMGEKEEMIRGVSEEELEAHPLDEEHYGVERTYTFEIKEEGWSATDRALIVLSRVLRRQKRKQRARQMRERLATLKVIATERLNRRKYKRRAYAWEQIQKQVLKRPGGEFIRVLLEGEDGSLRLSWEIDVEALREAMVLDGKFILVTGDCRLSGAEMVARYGEKDKVEKGFRTLKGPIRLRPIFLHREDHRGAGVREYAGLAGLLGGGDEVPAWGTDDHRGGGVETLRLPSGHLHHLRGRECAGADRAPEPPSARGGAGSGTSLVAGESGRFTPALARASDRMAEDTGEDTIPSGGLRSWPAEDGKGEVGLQVEEGKKKGARETG